MKGARIVFEWFDQERLDYATRDAGVEVEGGNARLHRRVVVADELGACNNCDNQPIDGRTWARKDFWLETADAGGARVAAWVRTAESGDGTREFVTAGAPENYAARLVVEVNGHVQTVGPNKALAPDEKEPWADYTHGYWGNAWRTVEVPPGWLKAGLNTVILRTADGSRWEGLIEASRLPNRSAQSLDNGQTWDYDHLGFNNCYDGEFLIRMELDRHPASGRIASEVIDLAAGTDALGVPVRLRGLAVEAEANVPPDTAVDWELRAGSTPAYNPDTWSAWAQAGKFQPRQADRFAQWRATLSTRKPLVTPSIQKVRLTADIDAEALTWGRINSDGNPPILLSSHPFGYQAPSARAAMLRERWHLDDIVAGAEDDYQAIQRLAHWTRTQWTDGWNREMKVLRYCPPWDAPLILELTRANLSMGMCTHYSTVFVQICAAIGIPARHLILKAHCSSEAWSDHWGKWIWVDAGGDINDDTMSVITVERDGVPLSALEARTAWVQQKVSDLRLVGRNAEKAHKIEKLASLDHFFIPLRNDHLTSQSPGEPEHGKVWYHYDGYLWWRDAQTRPLPWFSISSSRAADLYWTPNRTHIHLQRTLREGEVRVMLESSMPNFARLQVREGESDSHDSPPDFVWKLHRGRNVLAAKSVNAFGKEGAESQVTVNL